jgi:2-polyprenyl-3-methyl-5-hydroxy-6-metoxy-1,4-benzoquinol methylase
MHGPSESRQLLCPACGTTALQRRLYTKNGCDIFRCEACGTGRAEAAGFDPAAYYDERYFAGGRADGYADYVGSQPVLRRQFAREIEAVRRHRRSGRLVEIGCAYGFLLEEARRWFDVAGIEPFGEAAAHCRRRGLEVLTGTADADMLGRLGAADVFVLLDVVEHLPDPFETLAQCVGLLNPGGLIVLTTGDFGSTTARMAGSRWRLMTPPQHLWFLTAAGIRRWADRNGMRIEALQHPWKLVPLSLVAFQLARMAGLKPSAGARSDWGVPVNLFDAMRVVLRREASA